MKYQIEVQALGYETTTLVVNANSLREAKQSERQAKVLWCAHNDLGLDSLGLAFVRITKL